jgi:hypothetical protein
MLDDDRNVLHFGSTLVQHTFYMFSELEVNMWTGFYVFEGHEK